MLDGVADAITVQSPDLQADLRQRGGRARLRAAARPTSTRSRPRPTSRTSRCSTTPATRSTSRGCPGGSRSPGSIPSRSSCGRSNKRHRRGALGAHQGDRRCATRTAACGSRSTCRGHHRAQALRGVPALPGRGSRRLAGLALDYERTLAVVAELAVPVLGDDVRGRGWTTLERPGRGRRGAAHRRRAAGAAAADRADGRGRAGDRGADARARRARLRHPGRARGRGLRAARRRRGRERAAVRARRRRSRGRCRRRCCRRTCPTSRAPRWPPPTTRRGRASRSAATSTTSSRPARASGTSSSATSAARAPRPRR